MTYGSRRANLPYKLWVGATSESRAVGGIGYYIEVSATRLVTGFGAMALARDQLERFRNAIADEDSGREFQEPHGALTTASLRPWDTAVVMTGVFLPSAHPDTPGTPCFW